MLTFSRGLETPGIAMRSNLTPADAGLKTEPAEAPVQPVRRLRIMMIENDRADAALALREVRRAGFAFQADIVQTQKELNRRLDLDSYDVILSDYRLEGWTGIDALAQVRQRGIDIPFIMVTGSLGEESAVECMRQGASDYIVKEHLSRLPLALARAVEENSVRKARVRAEAVLRLTLEALQAAANGIVIADRSGTIVWVNAACGALTGYSPDELIGHNPRIFKSGRHDESFYRELWTTITNGGVWRGEVVNRRKNGSLYTEEMTITSVRDAHGGITNFIAVKQDITERKQTEDQIREWNARLEQRVAERTAELARANLKLESEVVERKMAEEALDRLQQQSVLILNAAADGIFRVDLDGKCQFVNHAAAHMLGYEPGDLIGQHLHTLIRHRLPDGLPCSWDECGIHQALALGVSRKSEGHIVQRKDGTSFIVDESITPVSEKDQVAGAVIMFRDVSKQKAMEKMKDEFVSVVSHELRTPLTAIRAALGLLAADDTAGRPARARRLLEIAINNAKRLVHLVNDILDDARLDSAHVSLARRVCTAAELIQQAVDLMRPMAESANVRLKAEAGPVELTVDPDAILQTLTNLLSNAIKFSPRGSIVCVEARQEEENGVFRVIDQGPGIPPEKQQTIFRRFQPVDASDSRRRGGTGLGLSICRRIVRHHGGGIWVESRPGRGSTFVFTVPLGQPGTEPPDRRRRKDDDVSPFY